METINLILEHMSAEDHKKKVGYGYKGITGEDLAIEEAAIMHYMELVTYKDLMCEYAEYLSSVESSEDYLEYKDYIYSVQGIDDPYGIASDKQQEWIRGRDAEGRKYILPIDDNGYCNAIVRMYKKTEGKSIPAGYIEIR